MRMELGNVAVTTGTKAEELADLALNDILYVADSAPEPIRTQAEAFRVKLRAILVKHFSNALGGH